LAAVSVCVDGTTANETRGSVEVVLAITVTCTLAETVPLYPCAVAVMAVMPVVMLALTTPVGLTVATFGMEEVQVTSSVMSFLVGWDALPNVPVAVNCIVAGLPITN